MSTPTNADRIWFKKNSQRNFRIRRGAPGEIEEIMRRSVVAARLAPEHELTAAQHIIGELDEGKEWRVLVANVGPDVLLKMLVARLIDSPDEMDDVGHGGAALAIVLGDRLVMDRIGG